MERIRRPSHQATEARYQKLRVDAIKAAQEVVTERYPNTRLELFSSKAIEAFAQWENDPRRVVDWPWSSHRSGYHYYKFRYPKRFEAVTWHRETLAGFALGWPTFSATGLRMDFIEKMNKVDLPLLDVVYIAMVTYAGLLGANHIRIMHPINAGVRDYYESQGFKYDRKGDFCRRDINYV